MSESPLAPPIQQSRAMSSRKIQRGAILVLAVAVLMTVLLVVAALLAILQRTVVGSYVATITDAAALAGTSSLVLPKGCMTFASVAAVGGGAECSSSHRWRSAPRLAAEAIAGSTLPGVMFAGSASIDGTENTPQDGSEFLMAGGSLTVRIERGTWRPVTQPDGSSPFRFTSLEDPTTYDRPGIPREFAFDAVRVTITARPNALPLANSLLPSALQITRSAIATANLNLAVPIAPFAIPLCSLLKRDFGSTGQASRYLANPPALPTMPPEMVASQNPNELYYRDICFADRLIAPVSRYCAANDTNCRGVVPQFNWDPSFMSLPSGQGARTGMTEYWRSTDYAASNTHFGPNRDTTNQSVGDRFCFWGSPRYLEPEDNFGVAVVPSVNSSCAGVSEDSALLVSGAGTGVGVETPQISLGNRVCVLPNGFTSARAREAIWARISGVSPANLPPGSPTPTPMASPQPMRGGTYPLVSESFITEPNLLNLNYAFQNSNPPPIPTSNSSGQCRDISRTPTAPLAQGTPPYPRAPRTFGRYGANAETGYQAIVQAEGGTCNSLRTGWGYWDEVRSDPTTASWAWYRRYRPPGSAATLDPDKTVSISDTGYWLTWAAVIADPRSSLAGGQSCGDAATNSFDPKLSAAVPYEVIGFVRMQVYDLDIGRRPPALPPAVGGAIGSAASFPYGIRASAANQYIPTIQPTPWANSPYRWAFDRADVPSAITDPGLAAEDNACNLVRTRLTCAQPPMPVVGGVDELVAPRLVIEQ